ncbi:hypothetical protein, partial [Phormidium sp. FACHB-1136]|uniref:hypothetical protein n=1 Tax=Phormidium sp. FACHB-1136 TaxID=2692848 RepID=UPI001A7E80A8
EGLVDEQTPASVKAVRAAREASNSGFPYKPIKDIEPPAKVQQRTRSRPQTQNPNSAPTKARSEMQMG